MHRFSLPKGMVALAVGGYLVVALGVVSIIAAPTRGPIPDEAFPSGGGPIDQDLVPMYIPALDRAGVEVGWVSRDLAVPVIDDGTRLLIPVYDDDLQTIVGHMVAGHGFAPIGTDLEPLLSAIPTAPLPAGVTE